MKNIAMAAALALTLGMPFARAAELASEAVVEPTAACDPYKDYSCLDSYLGTGVWERLTNYYKLEDGQAAAPADPKTPPSRRDDIPGAAHTTPPMPFTEWPY